MDEKTNENIRKRDLELILEVNKKAIEIETAVADQNEETIESLKEIRGALSSCKELLDKLTKQAEETNRDIFKIQVLFLSGLLSLAIQIIQIFRK